MFDRSRRGRERNRFGPDRDDQPGFGDAPLPQPAPSAGRSDPPGGAGHQGFDPGGSAVPSPEADPVSDPRTVAAILRSAPEPVVLFDAKGLVVDWNPAAETLLGYRRGEAVGRSVLGLVFPERLHGALETVFRGRGASWGEPERRAIEVSVRTRDAGEFPAEMTLSWAAGAELFVVHLRDRREPAEHEIEQAADARRRAAVNELGRRVMGHVPAETVYGEALRLAAEFGGLESCELWSIEGAGELALRAALGPRFESAPRGLRLRPVAGSRLAAMLHEPGDRIAFGDGLLPDPLDGPVALATAAAPSAPGVVALIVMGDTPIGVLSGLARPGFTFSAVEASHFTSLALIVAGAKEREDFVSSITEAEQRLRAVVERLPAITYSAGLGAEGRWHYVSPQVEEILGFRVEECLADHGWWERSVHPDDLPRVLAEEERCAAAGEPLDVEYRIRDRHGRTLWIRDRASIGRRGEGDQVIVEGLMVDVTAEKQAELRLRRLVDHDALTGLLNRRGFEQRLDRALAAAPANGGCVAILDIDHMKRINDSRGHAAGDAVLREVAVAVGDGLEVGQLLGRMSSDEFAVFLPGLDRHAAERKLCDLNSRIGDVAAPVALSASVGATMIDERSSAAELLVAADLALYGSKEAGRNRVTIDAGPGEGGMDWVGRVREAVEAGALAVYTQPIFDLGSGERTSEELLVRMLDDHGNTVPAEHFVPAAERFGLIRKVDRFVIERGIEAAALGRPVNVNVSAASVADPGLPVLLGHLLGHHGVADPALLTFEITETGATPTIEALRSFSDGVRELGCRLSLDDVGTGFGSLTYLQNLDFRQIKIDRQFVQALGTEGGEEGVVRSLVTIARELGLETVAEGVHSEHVRGRLLELGVDMAQGFHLGPPKPLVLTQLDLLP